jgi:hypothetical protein
MDFHMFAKVRPIKFDYPPGYLGLPSKDVAEGECRTNFHVKNVFSGNHESTQRHPAPEFDSIREDSIVLPEIFCRFLRHIYGYRMEWIHDLMSFCLDGARRHESNLKRIDILREKHGTGPNMPVCPDGSVRNSSYACLLPTTP